MLDLHSLGAKTRGLYQRVNDPELFLNFVGERSDALYPDVTGRVQNRRSMQGPSNLTQALTKIRGIMRNHTHTPTVAAEVYVGRSIRQYEVTPHTVPTQVPQERKTVGPLGTKNDSRRQIFLRDVRSISMFEAAKLEATLPAGM